MIRKQIHGDDLLYRFFNHVLPSDPELFERIPRLLIISMSVWFPKSVYQEMPILLPWVVRDPTCRGKRSRGRVVETDQWGAPNSDGLLRDDNSLVKGIPRSLLISSNAYSFVNGKNLGNEFVASHIWRKNQSGVLASRLPELNTFVPNLVWLPSQVAKLSDREDGVFQRALKEVSWGIYREIPLSPRTRLIAEKSWGLLPPPDTVRAVIDSEINWFVSTPRFMKTRKSKLSSVIAALDRISDDLSAPLSLQPSRYRAGLPQVDTAKRMKLRADLSLHDQGLTIEVDRNNGLPTARD